MKQINVVATELIKESKAVVDTAKDLKKGFSFNKLTTLAREVCVVVETYTDDVGELSSQVKLSLAIEILVNLVDIPLVPQWLERKIYNIALDKALKYLNEKFGDNWLDEFTATAETTKPAKTEIIAKRIITKTVEGNTDLYKEQTKRIDPASVKVVNGVVKKVTKAPKKLNKKVDDVRANLRKRTGL